MSEETSLTRSTEEMRQGLRDTYGVDTIAYADRSGEELRGVDFAARAPKVGERAPGFELSDARGERVALDDLLDAGTVVLVFYRGAWCPYCNLQLAAFRDRLDEIEAAGASLVAVSPQTPDASLSLAEKLALPFAVLSDAGNAVARSYGLEWINPEWHAAFQREHGVDVTAFNGDDSQRLPAAATFVIGPERRVRYVAISADYRWRIGPEEVLAALGR
jgi:peroxiredoxin